MGGTLDDESFGEQYSENSVLDLMIEMGNAVLKYYVQGSTKKDPFLYGITMEEIAQRILNGESL